MADRRSTSEPKAVFAANLRAVRSSQGISQEQLGHAAGIHPTAVARLETGNRDPRLATIAKIADALDIPAGDLLTGI